MNYQLKIIKSPLKLICSVVFLITLPFITAVSSVTDIGLAMDPYIAILASVIFADIYYLEVESNTHEIFYLKVENKMKIIFKRIIISYVFLIVLSSISFWMFLLVKKDIYFDIRVYKIFVESLFAFSSSILFFGIFTFTLVNIINIFSYGLTDNNYQPYEYWKYSKIIYLATVIIMLLWNKKLVEKSPLERIQKK